MPLLLGSCREGYALVAYSEKGRNLHHCMRYVYKRHTDTRYSGFRLDQINCPSGDRAMSSGNAWALICMLYADNVLEGREWGQQEKRPLHMGNSVCRKQHQSYRSRMPGFTLEAGSEGSKPFTNRISSWAHLPISCQGHVLTSSRAEGKSRIRRNPCASSNTGGGGCSPGSSTVLKTGGTFHPAFPKEIYDKGFQAKAEKKSWKGKLKEIVVDLHTRWSIQKVIIKQKQPIAEYD